MAEKNEKKTEINSDTIVGVQVLAEILKVDPRRVGQMVSEGKIPRYKNGKYKLVETLQKYHEYLSGKEKDKEQANAAGKIKSEAEKEKLKLGRIKREKAELELKLYKGELHKASDVERIYTGMILNAKSKLDAMPSKLAPKLINISDMNYIFEQIQNEVLRAENELAEYDVTDFLDEEVIRHGSS